MRIGVDARPLSKQLSGIGYYTLNVIKELANFGIEVTLFSPSPFSEQASDIKDIQSVCGNISNPYTRQIWSETVMPILLHKHDLDLFWGPAHRLPRCVPKHFATVLTIHDLVWKRFPETMRTSTLWLERVFMPSSVKRADLIIADSASTADDLYVFCKASRDKVRKIPLAPRALNEAETQNTCNSIESGYFLFVGTREPRKNLNSLIDAYAGLSDGVRQKHNLIVVGDDGWGNIDLEKQVMRLQITNNVKIKRYASNSELIALYKNAFCLVMPSLYEGYGLPILEAQKHGTPVITSNISSMPEVVGDGGLLVDPYSVVSIRSGLERMVFEKNLRETLSFKSYQNAAKYSWRKTAIMTADTFREAIDIKKYRIAKEKYI